MALILVEQKLILDSMLILFYFNASDTAKLPKKFPTGDVFKKTTRKAKNVISHLTNDNKHIIGVGMLTCFMSILCGLAVMVKGNPNEAHHDHMHGTILAGNGWLEAMTGNGPGKIAFNPNY